MKLVFWVKFILGVSPFFLGESLSACGSDIICFFVIERKQQRRRRRQQDDTLSRSLLLAYCHSRREWKVLRIWVLASLLCVCARERTLWGERNKVSWLVVQCEWDWNEMKNIKLLETHCVRHRCELHHCLFECFSFRIRRLIEYRIFYFSPDVGH